MGKKITLSLREIFAKTNFIYDYGAIGFITEYEPLIQEFKELYETNGNSRANIQRNINNVEIQRKAKELLIKYEPYVDKEKLVLILVYTYKRNVELLKNTVIPNLREQVRKANNASRSDKISNLEKILELNGSLNQHEEQLRIQSECLKNAIKIGQGIDEIILMYYTDEVTRLNTVEVLDSRELIDGKKPSRENRRKLEKIDRYFREDDDPEGLGLEFVLQALLLTDLNQVFTLSKLGDLVRSIILEKVAIEKNITNIEELCELQNVNYEEYARAIESVPYSDMIRSIKPALIQYANYLDIDKMLLIAAHRMEEYLENEVMVDGSEAIKNVRAAAISIDPDKAGKLSDDDIRNIIYENSRKILEGIKYFVKPHSSYRFLIQKKADESRQENEKIEFEDLEYSTDDIEDCLKRLDGSKYLTKARKAEIIKAISEGQSLYNFIPEEVYKAFSNDELLEIILSTDENTMYYIDLSNMGAAEIEKLLRVKGSCSKKLVVCLLENKRININNVIDFYQKGLVSIETIKEIKEDFDFTRSITQDEILRLYGFASKKDSTKEELESYSKYLELYREIFIIDRNEEEIEESSKSLIEKLIDQCSKKYVEDLESLYVSGIITIDSILEWENLSIIKTFYKDHAIDVNGIISLASGKRLEANTWIDLVVDMIANWKVSDEEKISLLSTCWIPDDIIKKLFVNNNITQDILRTLRDKGIITEYFYNDLIYEIKIANKESLRGVDLTGSSKKQGEEQERPSLGGGRSKQYPDIIDPEAKHRYFDLLRLRPIANDTDKGNAFYNYEFYELFDEKLNAYGNIPVIAEMDYQDKDTKTRFAYDNATYFFQYHDLDKVRDYLSKNTAITSNDDLVFRAFHDLAEYDEEIDEETGKEVLVLNKVGSWAVGVLYGIAQTVIGKRIDRDKVSGREKAVDILLEIYGHERLKEILDFAGRIDMGEFDCEIIDSGSGAIKNNPSPNFDDDDEDQR